MNERIDAGMDQKAEKMWMIVLSTVPCSFGPINNNDDDLKRLRLRLKVDWYYSKLCLVLVMMMMMMFQARLRPTTVMWRWTCVTPCHARMEGRVCHMRVDTPVPALATSQVCDCG